MNDVVQPRAAYVHVPFCAHRCGYCDFTLVAKREDLVEGYLEALAIELKSLQEPREVDTLFLGGGTPTHLTADELGKLLDLLGRWFRLSANGEFSCEANPAGFSREKMQRLADAGVNRVSLGMQSFDAEILRTLERDHDAKQIERVVADLQGTCGNIGVDLIFGVPGQTLELWRETLRRAIDLGVQHVSTYGLTFEKGTAFWTRRSKGTLVQVADELEREMYAAAMDELPAAGFEQYELSNFGRPGFRCRHNQVYWGGESYYGFGPGAARYIAGRRESNHRSVTTWIQRVRAGQSAIGMSEELEPEERARELLVLGLRRAAGVQREEFQRQTGFDLDSLVGEQLQAFAREGLVEEQDGWVRLTQEGRFVADAVVVECL